MTYPSREGNKTNKLNLTVNPKQVNKTINKAAKNTKIQNHQLQEILRKINFDF